MPDLLILTDGGGGIGFGHLVRCLAIKDAWKYEVRLLAHMAEGMLPPDGVEIFDWLNQPEKLSKFSSESTIVLVDSYRPNKNYFLLLKGLFKFVVVLDDYNRITYPVDLVICPGIYGEDMDYNNQTCISIGGAKYVVIRPNILAAKQISVSKDIKSILVTFGGSQSDKRLYQRAIELIEFSGYNAVVVTGNDKLAQEIVSKFSKIYGRLDAATMAEVMASVDMAVSAAGQTLNELAWLGVPTFSIRTGLDQQGNWRYYNSHSLSLAAVLHDDANWESELKMVLKNETYKSRLERSHRLKNLLTDKGAEEICSLIDGCFEVIKK